MPAPWTYSETMSLATADPPRRHRLTVSDYYRMAEVGILAPDARVELIEGEIFDMAPPGSLHASTVHRLNKILVHATGDDALVLVQNPVRLSELSEPQPDLALLRDREDFYARKHPGPADVLLVVEVADSSLRFDRETKAALYAAHGIPEMWLVDLRGRRLIRQRAPQEGVYMQVDEPDLDLPLEISGLPGVAIDLQQLFGR
jgi:Uma2 family endonuclease